MLTLIKDLVQGKTTVSKRRSPKWPGVRQAHLEKNPKCIACGGTAHLQVHHVVPFHIAPERELDPTNLATLCESKKYGVNCHLFAGHKGTYKSVNKDWKISVELIKSLLQNT